MTGPVLRLAFLLHRAPLCFLSLSNSFVYIFHLFLSYEGILSTKKKNAENTITVKSCERLYGENFK